MGPGPCTAFLAPVLRVSVQVLLRRTSGIWDPRFFCLLERKQDRNWKYLTLIKQSHHWRLSYRGERELAVPGAGVTAWLLRWWGWLRSGLPGGVLEERGGPLLLDVPAEQPAVLHQVETLSVASHHPAVSLGMLTALPVASLSLKS